jgi:hypothetical protein
MSDEKFEGFLQREAKGFNAPPPSVPREEMWHVITRARTERGAARPLVVTPATRRPGLRYAPWIGMAATLLVGVGIGRYALQRGESGLTQAPTSIVAAAPESPAIPTTSDAPAPATRNSTSIASSITPEPTAPRRPSPRAGLPATRLAAGSTAELQSSSSPAYQVASQRHLAGAEALVSAIATTPRDAMIDSLTARWAREMLTNTRLLLDSPAGEDPIRRRLLEDLETLLVQLVQRSGAAVDERALIDRTLERTQLLTLLRSGATGT